MNVDSPYMLFVADVLKNIRTEMTESESLFGIDKLNVPKSQVRGYTRRLCKNPNSPRRYKSCLPRFDCAFSCIDRVSNAREHIFQRTGRTHRLLSNGCIQVFLGTELDILVVGDFFLEKDWQDPTLRENYVGKYELDKHTKAKSIFFISFAISLILVICIAVIETASALIHAHLSNKKGGEINLTSCVSKPAPFKDSRL